MRSATRLQARLSEERLRYWYRFLGEHVVRAAPGVAKELDAQPAATPGVARRQADYPSRMAGLSVLHLPQHLCMLEISSRLGFLFLSLLEVKVGFCLRGLPVSNFSELLCSGHCLIMVLG